MAAEHAQYISKGIGYKRYRKERIRTSPRLPFSATKSFYFRFAKIIGDTAQTFSAIEQKRQWGDYEGVTAETGDSSPGSIGASIDNEAAPSAKISLFPFDW